MPNNPPYRIILAGTPEFAAEIFKPIIEKYKNNIVGIITQPDKPRGRGQKISPSPVKILAQQYNISIIPGDDLEALKNLEPDLVIVVAYGVILSKKFLAIPKLGCINVHASLLPKLRGAAPIQHAILQGFKETGITIMQLVQKMDAGPVFAQSSCEITEQETSGSLYNKLIKLSQDLIINILPDILEQKIKPVEQDSSQVTFAPKIEKQDAKINWYNSAINIERQIRACLPKPVAFFEYKNINIKVFGAEVVKNNNNIKSKPGDLIELNKNGILVACGDNDYFLNIKNILLPGSRHPVDVREYLNSNKLQIKTGDTLINV